MDVKPVIISPPDLLNSLNIEQDPSQFYHQEKSFYQEELLDKLQLNMSYIPNSATNIQYTPQVTSQQQQIPQVPPPSYHQQQVSSHHQPPHPVQTHVTMMKRKMTLDLANAKRPRSVFSTGQTPTTADILSSPDFNKLGMSTPEMEKLIMSSSQNSNALQTPTSVFFPKNVTEEQELYAKGFENALKQLHAESNTTSSSFSQDHDDNSSTASSYNSASKPPTFHDFSNVIIKEEPQTVPDDMDDSQSSSGADDDFSGGSTTGSRGSKISPIDMASQEKQKLERKRQRNRLAASKCRKKKLERIAKLEDKVKQLKGENTELANVRVKLLESVQVLKSQVMEHVQAGCAIVVNMGGSGGNFS